MNYYDEKESLVIGENIQVAMRTSDIIMAGMVVYDNGSRAEFEAFCRIVNDNAAITNKPLYNQVLENLLKNTKRA